MTKETKTEGMTNNYDIFISYKRKSLPTANNLYYRLTTRGYSTFFDLEEMGRDNFNVQLLNYIEKAKDVFVILEEGSLDACKRDDWEKDWFCHEIAFALEKKKNIIPILIGGYTMPSEDFFPDKLKELSLKNAPEFNFSFFEAYLDKLVEKKYLLSKPNVQDKVTSVFKLYSNQNCLIFKEGKLVCSLEAMSDEPYYLPVPKKGDYRFKVVNTTSKETRIQNVSIDVGEEKNIEIKWDKGLINKNPFHGMYKGCVLTIIAFLLMLIIMFVLLMFWRTSDDTNIPPDSPIPYSMQDEDSNCSKIEDENNYEEIEEEIIYDGKEEENSVPLTSGDYVDLGLSVYWASRNVGAASPEDAGGYYAWGETKEKDEYSLETYAYKYSEYGYIQAKEIASDISGTRYDVARSLLGGDYRMPTKDEMKELILKCEWHYGKIKGVSGMVVTGENGNCIFIPDVGKKRNMSTDRVCYYWTSTAGEHGTPYSLSISAYSSESRYDLVSFVSVAYGLPVRSVVSK